MTPMLILEHTTRAAALSKPARPSPWKKRKRRGLGGWGTQILPTGTIQMFALCSCSYQERRRFFALYRGDPRARRMGHSRALQQSTTVYCPFLSLLHWKRCVFRAEMWLYCIVNATVNNIENTLLDLEKKHREEKNLGQSSCKQTGHPGNINTIYDMSVRYLHA